MQSHKKNNFIKIWWKLIDQQTVFSIFILVMFSLVLVITASPSVASRIGLDDNYFFLKHIVFLTLGLIIIFTFSVLDKNCIRKIAILGFFASLIMLILVKLYGLEIKGATRWINISGFSCQPSEFIKPFFAVITGWILSFHYYEEFPSFKLCFLLFLLVAVLLIIQPDIGMFIMISTVFILQLFISGLPIIWLFITISISLFLSILAYLLLHHVTSRVNKFFAPVNNGNYQIARSLEAFESGGLYGKGPGEGIVKQFLPDSHTDFIFAVAGEEFGAIICLVIISIFAYTVFRILVKLLYEDDKFIQIASVGIISQFGLQAFINMAVSLNLLPTKGTTLPFISYGGSSTLSVSIGIGMLLGLTKRKTSLRKYRLQDFEI